MQTATKPVNPKTQKAQILTKIKIPNANTFLTTWRAYCSDCSFIKKATMAAALSRNLESFARNLPFLFTAQSGSWCGNYFPHDQLKVAAAPWT
jgi:hypothetical protein